MNKQRRAELAAIAESLSELKDRLETCKTEEEEYLENMPENLQESDKHAQSEACVDNLDDAVSSLDDTLTSINDAIEN